MPARTYRHWPAPVLPLLLLAGLACHAGDSPGDGGAAPREIILATTTSTVDSGLLDILLPEFSRQTGYTVKPLSLGSGQALEVAARGEADVLLVHSPEAEESFMAAGHGVHRTPVMHNDFVLAGPRDDPAGVREAASALDAIRRIAAAGHVFVSRGDGSGTHALELTLWAEASIDPRGNAWYLETGQGMGATLLIASDRDGYVLTDRGTYLAQRANLALDLVLEGDAALVNAYHAIAVNPAQHPGVNADGATAFIGFLVSPATQAMIAGFGVAAYGQPLFVPDAGGGQ